ncbi:MAG: cytochrome c [Saprospiraceae bacterium]|nr:cytochrome c [Saprospiraceae bacterium]
MRIVNYLLLLSSILVINYSCSKASGNRTGHEYMPDMSHAVSYEANVDDYYEYNHFGTEEEYLRYAGPRMPVKGSIPRGYVGLALANSLGSDESLRNDLSGQSSINGISVPFNGNVPYYYENNEDERTRATREILYNPYPITKSGLEQGKKLYDIYCGVCHGVKGDGNGFIYENGVYPAAPANFLDSAFVRSSNGRYFHAIMYGKNVMGSYKDKLSYEERWQVIHHIRSLQAAEKKLTYDENSNTFDKFSTPGALVKTTKSNATNSEVVVHTDTLIKKVEHVIDAKKNEGVGNKKMSSH